MKILNKRILSAFISGALFLNSTVVTGFSAEEQVTDVVELSLTADPLEIDSWTSAPSMSFFAIENDKVALNSGNYEKWIDRVDIPGYAETLYNTLANETFWTTASNFTVEGAYDQGDFIGIKVCDIPITSTNSSTATGNELAATAEVVAASKYIRAAYDALDRDHPEISWLSGSTQTQYKFSGTGSSASVSWTAEVYFVLVDQADSFDVRSSGYRDVSSVSSAINAVDSRVTAIKSAVTGTTDYEKIVQINDWLTTNNEYNTSADLDAIDNSCRECISALQGKTGTLGPVCEGYARAFKVLCDSYGIPCVLVDGDATNSSGNTEAHMWNYVQLDGKWYAADVTWNDPTGGNSGAISGFENADYLAVGSSTVINDSAFISSHRVSNSVSLNGTNFTNGPALNTSAYVPAIVCGSHIDGNDADIKCDACGADLVASVGTASAANAWYTTLEEAFENSTLTNCDINVLADTVVNESITADVFTNVYLNGHTVTFANGKSFTNSSDVTVYFYGILGDETVSNTLRGNVEGGLLSGNICLKNAITVENTNSNGYAFDFDTACLLINGSDISLSGGKADLLFTSTLYPLLIDSGAGFVNDIITFDVAEPVDPVGFRVATTSLEPAAFALSADMFEYVGSEEYFVLSYSYENNEQTVTFAACTHTEYTDGICDECGYECEHNIYVNGICNECSVICKHESFTDGICDTCGDNCRHSDVDTTTGICEKCKSQMAASVTWGGVTTNYVVLDEALYYWISDATLTLLSDITVTQSIMVPTGYDLTLDLNGKKITKNSDNVIYLDNGNLTIQDTSTAGTGEIMTSASNCIYVSSGSILEIKSGTVSSADISVCNTGTFTFSGGTITSDMYAIDQHGTFSFTGGTIKGSAAIHQIAGSTEVGADIVFNKADYGSFILYCGGTVDLSAADIPETDLYNSSEADAVVDEAFILPAGYYVFVDDRAVDAFEESDVLIIRKHASHDGEIEYIDNKDGTHNGVYSCCGVPKIKNEAHTLTDGVCTTCKAQMVASVTKNGVTTAYTVFDDALSEWTDASTLTLLSDITITEVIRVSDGDTLILELNGKKIKKDTDDNIYVEKGGKLTIQDTSDAGTGEIANDVRNILVSHNAELEIKSGTVSAGDVSVNNAGTFTLSGGTLVSELYAVEQNGTFNFIDGTIQSDGLNIMHFSGTTVIGAGAVLINTNEGDHISYYQGTLDFSAANITEEGIRVYAISDGNFEVDEVFALPADCYAFVNDRIVETFDVYDVVVIRKHVAHDGEIKYTDNNDGTHSGVYSCCGISAVENENHVLAEDKCAKCNASFVAMVSKDEDVAYYDDFESAIDACTGGEILTLLSDTVVTDTAFVIDKDITINVNGKEIYSSDETAFKFTSGCNVTIKGYGYISSEFIAITLDDATLTLGGTAPYLSGSYSDIKIYDGSYILIESEILSYRGDSYVIDCCDDEGNSITGDFAEWDSTAAMPESIVSAFVCYAPNRIYSGTNTSGSIIIGIGEFVYIEVCGVVYECLVGDTPADELNLAGNGWAAAANPTTVYNYTGEGDNEFVILCGEENTAVFSNYSGDFTVVPVGENETAVNTVIVTGENTGTISLDSNELANTTYTIAGDGSLSNLVIGSAGGKDTDVVIEEITVNGTITANTKSTVTNFGSIVVADKDAVTGTALAFEMTSGEFVFTDYDDTGLYDLSETEYTYTGEDITETVKSNIVSADTISYLGTEWSVRPDLDNWDIFVKNGENVVTPVNVGSYVLVIENDTQSSEFAFTIVPMDIADTDITITNPVYDGTVQGTEIVVKNGDKVLEKDKDYTVSGDYSGTEVGTYTAIIEGTGNYKGRTEIDWNITVLKVTGILNLIQGDEGETAALSKVYDGSAEYEIENPEDYSVVFTTADDVTSEYRLDENCRITVTFEDANAGTEKDYEYSIEFSDEMAASFGITAPMTGVPSERNGTIYPKELSSVTVILKDVQFTYTGSVIEPSLTVKDGSAIIPADQYEVSYTDNTNVGTATITVSSKESANYIFEGEATFEIIKAKATVSAAPTAQELTYNGVEQSLLNFGECNGGTMVYSLTEDGEYSDVIPVAVNAGKYIVYYYVDADINHYDSEIGSVSVTIEKADPDYTIPTNITAVYGDTLADVILPDGFSFDDALTTSVGNVGGRSFTATYTPEDSDNYNAVADIEIIVTVKKATPIIPALPTATEITYGQKLMLSVLSDTDWKWVDENIVPTVSNNGYEAFISVDDENYDYSLVDGYDSTISALRKAIPVTVKPAALTLKADDRYMVVGNELPAVSELTYTADGLVESDDIDTPPTLGYSGADNMTVGEYDIIISGAKDDNYTISYINGKLYVGECDHSGTMTLKYDADYHWYYCENCKTDNLSKNAHTGGTATCAEKAVCTVCKQAYGNVDKTNHITSDTWAYDTDGHWHNCACGEKFSYDVHSGGTANCTEQAVCAICKISYGTALGHTWKTEWTNNSTHHWHECEKADCSVTDITKMNGYAVHSFGEWVTVKSATNTTPGFLKRTCACGYEEEKVIPPTGSTTPVIPPVTTPGSTAPSWNVTTVPATSPVTTTSSSATTTLPPDDEIIEDDIYDDDDTDDEVDAIEPQIKGDNGKMGWDAIEDEISEASDGDKIIVDMNGATEVPEEIFEAIRGMDIDLVIELDNSFIWTINGVDVFDPTTLDLGVEFGSDIPLNIFNYITGEISCVSITLAYEGEFGLTAVLSVDLGDKNAGYYAHLHYYDGEEFEFICVDKINSNGIAELTFMHASEYIIVIDDDDCSIPDYENSVDEDDNPFTAVTISFTGVIVSAAAVMLTKKRRK